MSEEVKKEQKEKVSNKSYAELVIETGNELAKNKDFVGLDEKVEVKYSKDDGSFKKGDKRKMGVIKANTKQKQGIVKIIA